jgi:hypothetical protein
MEKPMKGMDYIMVVMAAPLADAEGGDHEIHEEHERFLSASAFAPVVA